MYPHKDSNYTGQKPYIARNCFIVGSSNAVGEVSFSSAPEQHMTEATALNEAKRLASVNPGKQFIVAKVVAVATLPISSPVFL